MTPLHRALALAEVHDIAVMVAEHLELDVPRMLQILFDVHVAVRRTLPRPHAAPSATISRSSSAVRTTRIPRPPPPATALMITG